MKDFSAHHYTFDISALSGIAGSISIACWIVVFSPQIIENFRRSSAEGLSVTFIAIWLVGDVFNILGGILQGILPTMLILAWYYTFADIVIILQYFYYQGFALYDRLKTPENSSPPTAADESAPLLTNDSPLASSRRSSSTIREHLTATFSNNGTHLSPAVPIHSARDVDVLKARSPVQTRTASFKSILFHITALVVVCAAGVLGWYISVQATSPRRHHDVKSKPDTAAADDLTFNLWGQIFGYICAILYLGSRVPQLLLNYRRKSTEGVSMLFFLFAVLGNVMFTLSVVAYEAPCRRARRHVCRDGQAAGEYWRYVLVNLSWLLGSVGTLLLDSVVFVQWFLYRDEAEVAVY